MGATPRAGRTHLREVVLVHGQLTVVGADVDSCAVCVDLAERVRRRCVHNACPLKRVMREGPLVGWRRRPLTKIRAGLSRFSGPSLRHAVAHSASTECHSLAHCSPW